MEGQGQPAAQQPFDRICAKGTGCAVRVEWLLIEYTGKQSFLLLLSNVAFSALPAAALAGGSDCRAQRVVRRGMMAMHRQHSGADPARRCNKAFAHAAASAGGTSGVLTSSRSWMARLCTCPRARLSLSAPSKLGPRQPHTAAVLAMLCTKRVSCRGPVQRGPATLRIRWGPGDRGPGTSMLHEFQAPGAPFVMHHRCSGTHGNRRTSCQMLQG